MFESLGYFVGFQTFLALRRRRGDVVQGAHRPWLVLAAIAGAIVGAKVLAWLEDPGYVWAHRGEVAAWLEGKTIVGGLLVGWMAVELVKRRLGVRNSTGDLYAIPLALGIAVGRIGCFLTGLDDRTYGTPTSLPWGVDFGDGILRHPTQLYEMAFLLLVLIPALLAQSRRGPREGDPFRLFMLGYLAWRLAVGWIQPAPLFLGLSGIQWACLAGLAYLARDVPRLVGSLTAKRTSLPGSKSFPRPP